jgi:hypothetical protein
MGVVWTIPVSRLAGFPRSPGGRCDFQPVADFEDPIQRLHEGLSDLLQVVGRYRTSEGNYPLVIVALQNSQGWIRRVVQPSFRRPTNRLFNGENLRFPTIRGPPLPRGKRHGDAPYFAVVTGLKTGQSTK